MDSKINCVKNEKMNWNYFLHADTNSCKLEDDWEFWGWAWPKMGVASLVIGLQNWLYLKNEQMEWTDFLHAGTNQES